MRSSQANLSVVVLGAGLSVASGAWAEVMLLSQTRSITVVAGSTRSDSSSTTADWSSNRLFSLGGANGYWNGATQMSSFQPDGSAALGEAMMAQGSVKSVRFGTFAPSSTWTAQSVFQSSFRVGATPQLADITMAIQTTGTGSTVAATLMLGTTTVWSFSSTGSDLQTIRLTSGDYVLRVEANSRLTTAGAGGEAQFSLGMNFVPGPAAAALIPLSAFLRRRRT